MTRIAPSILSADFSCLRDEIKKIETAGADIIHVDVMDGHFVPNITMGPLIVKALKKITSLPLDVHLMIENPLDFIPQFAETGSDIISFHAEAASDPIKTIDKIISFGKIPALAINPDFDISNILKFLPHIKMLLIMSVFPGFAGQEFIPSVLPKIKAVKDIIKKNNYSIEIEVDGGINSKNAKDVVINGADILVAGSAIFKSIDYGAAINSLKA